MNKEYIEKIHLFYDKQFLEEALFLEISFLDKDIELKNKVSSFYNELNNIYTEILELNNNKNNTIYTENLTIKTNNLLGITNKTTVNNKKIKLFINYKLNNINRRTIPIINNFINYLENILNKIINNNLFINKYPTYIINLINYLRLYQKILNKIEINNKKINDEEEQLCLFDNLKNKLIILKNDIDPIESNYIEKINNLLIISEDIINNYKNKSNLIIELLDQYQELIIELIIDNNLKSRIIPLYKDNILKEIIYLRSLFTIEEII